MKPRDLSKHREESRKVGAPITTHVMSVHTIPSNPQDLISGNEGTPPNSVTVPNRLPKSKIYTQFTADFKSLVEHQLTYNRILKKISVLASNWFCMTFII